MPGVHAPYAPSAAARWTVCSASVPLAASAEALGLVDDTDSPYARAGTVAMHVLEHWLRYMPDATAAEAAAAAAAEDKLDITEIEPDMLEAVAFAHRHLRDHIDRSRMWGAEQKVSIPEIPSWGSVDFWCFMPDGTVLVVDYKHGSGVGVEVEGNWQVMLYAAGLLRELALPDDAPVRLVICQPRHETGGWKQWETTAGMIRGRVAYAAERARTFEYKTGEHCRWCPAALICGERFKQLRSARDIKRVEDLAADRLAEVMDAAPLVADMAKAAKNVAVARLQAGKTIPGYMLGEGRGMFQWRAGATDKLREVYGEAAFTKPEPLSPAAVRDTLTNGAEFVREHTFRKPGRPTPIKGEAEPTKINWPEAQGTNE